MDSLTEVLIQSPPRDEPAVQPAPPAQPQSDNMRDTEVIFDRFAIGLAILGKVVSGLSQLTFVWATVVILGAFATLIETIDFWFVTIILFIEGTCTVRTRDGKWQHKVTLKVPSNSSWKLFKPPNMKQLLFTLQLLLVLTCGVLCLYRLVKQDYGVVSVSTTKNRKWILNIFYTLSLGIAVLYLFEDFCWQTVDIILFPTETARYVFIRGYGFSRSEMNKIYPLFYDIYSWYNKGSVFQPLKREFVPYSVELLLSTDTGKQLMGTQVLSVLAGNNRFSDKTRKIMGSKPDAMEKLIKMLKWQHADEKEIRNEAALIVLRIVTMPSSDQVMTISHSIESIGSLLDHSEDQNQDAQGYSDFSLLGLKILESLVKPGAKIESIKDLLPKIIGLTKLDDEHQFHALELLRLLSLNEDNCQLMMKTQLGHDHPNLMASLVSLLNNSLQDTVAMRILSNLLKHTHTNGVELKEISKAAAAKVVVFVMEKQGELQEAAIGLAAKIFKFNAKLKFVFYPQNPNGVTILSLIWKLSEFPIGRFSIDLLIAVINMDRPEILNSMSKEVIQVLRRELKEGNIQSFLTAADEHFHVD